MMLLVNGVPWEPDIEEHKSYFIEYWYDRHQQYWVVQVFDSHNDAEVECVVGLFKEDVASTVDAFKIQYNTTDVRHK